MIRDTMNNLTTRKIARRGLRVAVSGITATAIVIGALVFVGLSALTKENAGASNPASMNPPKLATPAATGGRASATAKPGPATIQGGPIAGFRAVYFRITTRGIDPATLTLPPGRYLVAIDNDSGFNAADVRITQVSGPQLQRAQMPSGVRKWRGYVDFTPGTVVLTDPGNAKRVCKLKITDP